MSAMALSNSTLSGCRVSFVIGFSYFFLRKQEVFSRLKTAASRMKLRRIDLEKTICHLVVNSDLNRYRLPGDILQMGECRRRVGGVKNRRPCDDPVTPGAHRVAYVIRRDPAVNLDRQRNT